MTEPLLERAVKLHGHLGPFLIIGLRMGLLAKNLLDGEPSDYEVNIIEERPPYCAIDGIRALFGEPLKLSFEDTITAIFSCKSRGTRVVISVKKGVIEEYRHILWEECKDKAREVMNMREGRLFEICFL